MCNILTFQQKGKPPDSEVDLDPSRYNGVQLYQPAKNGLKYCINVDRLVITLRGKLVDNLCSSPPAQLTYDDNNIQLELIDDGRGTKHYCFKYHLYVGDDQQPFALLLTAPRPGGILEDDLNECKILNEWFYTEKWTAKLRYVLSALPTELNNVTGLDVALDGPGFLPFFQRFQRGEIDRMGRGAWKLHGEGQREITGFDWGRRTAARWLTAYNKSKELRDAKKAPKPYIPAFWQRSGLGVDGDVERLELKLRSEAIKRIVDPATGNMGLELERLEETAYLAGIMRSQFKNWFEFVPAGEDENLSRRKKKLGTVDPVDWAAIKNIEMKRASKVNKPNEKWRAERATTKLIADAARDTYLDDFLHAQINRRFRNFNLPRDVFDGMARALAYEMADRHGIRDWLRRKESKMHETETRERQRAIEQLMKENAAVPLSVDFGDLEIAK